MPNLNQVNLCGHLTRDPELKYTQTGKTLCQFGIAYNHTKDKTSFFDCVAWGKVAETIAGICNKGDAVFAGGELEQQTWKTAEGQARSKVQVIVRTFLVQKKTQTSDVPGTDNDIPF
jgi:single-strand DNA-binding protein